MAEHRDGAPRVFVGTFGCQMNKLDSELVVAILRGHGYDEAATLDDADVVIYNTCSVRARAEDKVYSYLGALKQRKQRQPGLVVGVMGCMAQRAGEEILARAPHVDFVCGTRAFPHIPALIDAAREGRRVADLDTNDRVAIDRRVALRPRRRRAFVSIMRGCDNYCSYCIVPYVRGNETSRPPGEVVDEVAALVADGCREVTLLGQTVNSYGKGLAEKTSLAALLRRLGEIEGLARLRFVTSHPRRMTPELFEAMAAVPAVCEHLHLPAQAGADAVLAAMNRRYTRAEYLDIIDLGRRLAPGIAYAGDFIVGFPGESAADFEQTVDLVRRVRYQNSFIFKYSPRPGTRAADAADDVPREEKARRNQALLKVQEEVSRADNEAMIGRTVEVLADGPSPADPARNHGRTRQNHIVVFDAPGAAPGELVTVRIDSATPLTLFGSVVPANGKANP